MRVFPLKPFAGILLLSLCWVTGYATVKTAATGDWETAGTWTPAAAPTCGDTLIIPAGVTVTVTAVNDYYGTCVSPEMVIHVYGTLEFQTGKKLKLPCNSVVGVHPPSGLIDPGTGSGNSNTIEVCGTVYWNAASGPLGPGNCVPMPSCSSVLPIELLSFTAMAMNSYVLVQWTTGAQVNNDYFTVQRTRDGMAFEDLAVVDGAGNSTQAMNYTAYDEAPYYGISYYRLKQTDFNQASSYSYLVAVEFSPSGVFSMDVYPNPSDGSYTTIVLHSPPEQEIVVMIHDQLGQEFFSKVMITDPAGSTLIPVDRSGKLEPGVYLVSVSSGSSTLTKKLIVY
ncbi:MAG: T9SS type A sorting domain-containing protein [Bacteroidota bacterium]